MLLILVARLARRRLVRASLIVPYVIASASTVVPVGVSRVPLAEHLESAPCLDEFLPSRHGNLLGGDLECLLPPSE